MRNSVLGFLVVLMFFWGDIFADESIDALISQQIQSSIYDHNHKVRVIYLIPSDRQEVDAYTKALKHAILNIQDWYLKQLSYDRTFTLSKPDSVVEVVQSMQPESWFSSDAGTDKWIIFNKTNQETERILGKRPDNEIWVIYVDANRSENECNSSTIGGLNGGGGTFGLTIMPADDLNGLIGNGEGIICRSTASIDNNPLRWVGGGAHEIGHSFGLPHPTDVGRQCDKTSCLMEMGYTMYPATELTEVGKNILTNNPVFSPLPVINYVFDIIEKDYNLESQATRKFDYTDSSLFYRYYGNDNYIIEKNGILFKVFNDSIENMGKIKDWFLGYTSKINPSSSDYFLATNQTEENYTNIINNLSNKCLKVQNSDNLSQVVISTCSESDIMLWEKIGNDNSFNLKNVYSSKCLDVNYGSVENWADIVQYQCHTGDSMKWGGSLGFPVVMHKM